MKDFFTRLSITILVIIVGLFSCVDKVDSGFPLVFPFLTTGWYYKPGPAESVVLGLLLVKVLAIRLGSATGILPIPYHLNDLFSKKVFKRSTRVGDNHTFGNVKVNLRISDEVAHDLTNEEIAVVERMLLGIRRIDSNDCFIRLICQMNQDVIANKGSEEDEQLLRVFRLRPSGSAESASTAGKTPWSIWRVYESAIRHETMNCNKKYPSCPLTENDLRFESLLTGLF